MSTFDLIIHNGRLHVEREPFLESGAIGIRDDRIEFVGKLPSNAQAETMIDAGGNLICPGFIDIHTHSDLSALACPECESKVFQGVTTEVVGNCSFSAFPINPAFEPDHINLLKMIGRVDVPLRWKDLNGYADFVAQSAPAINVAPLVGHGTLRIAAGIGADPTPSRERTARMLQLLNECFEQGAFGFTTGLTYIPSMLAEPDEIAKLLKATRAHDRLYATHARSGGPHTEMESFEEAAAATRDTQVRLQFSHLALNQPSNWGKAADMLERFHQLKSEGFDVAFDVYPYAASSSALVQHMPGWVQEGGLEAMRKRLAVSALRARVIEDLKIGWWNGIEGSWQWDRFVISAAPGAPELIGRSIAELAAEDNVSGEEFTVRLCEEFGNEVHIVLHYRQEDDVISFLKDELASIGSDGLAMPAINDGSRVHPRSYGSFPRVLDRFVRNLGALPLEDAIRKMTSAPADRLRLRDRGRLVPGHFADVVVIDTEHVTDRATFVNPFLLAEGVETVVVNGKVVVQNRRPTGIRAGRLLRYNT